MDVPWESILVHYVKKDATIEFYQQREIQFRDELKKHQDYIQTLQNELNATKAELAKALQEVAKLKSPFSTN
jgi:peptidoglycan hydrolase CwlO-like protein